MKSTSEPGSMTPPDLSDHLKGHLLELRGNPLFLEVLASLPKPTSRAWSPKHRQDEATMAYWAGRMEQHNLIMKWLTGQSPDQGG